MEETFLSRFDALDVRVRKVLQSCAVLGLSFVLSDVLRVHPEMSDQHIEGALDTAVDEMILLEQVEEEEESSLAAVSPTGAANISRGEADSSVGIYARSSENAGERFFQFSHAMWRNNVLATMLKERKIELHRSIAESMERDQGLSLEKSDISRLLTLFDHWKSCGDFCKSAPLALAVGSRLEEWDLSAQSLELYEDALEMSFDSVQKVHDGELKDAGPVDDEWVTVQAHPAVLDLILRIHIRMGLCYQNMGDEEESILFFEDAYNIIKTASKVPGMSVSLLLPIISTLAVLKLDKPAPDSKTKREQENLVQMFVADATANGSPVHIGRALAMEAKYYARTGRLDSALQVVEKLQDTYDIEDNSFDMIGEYGRDFALECLAESIYWYYLKENHEKAEEKADMIVDKYLAILDPVDIDSMMSNILPIIHVFPLLGRTKDADWLFKKYVINPYHDNDVHSAEWSSLFNPIAYLLEIIIMEERGRFNRKVLQEMERFVLDQENNDFLSTVEKKAHTTMGELCWRLANALDETGGSSRDDSGPNSTGSRKATLLQRAKDLLTPIARYPHQEIFLRQTAQALLETM
jgi:tetratricopeptide (TPR) repeat protein